ncbi:MAG: diacylglycerol kinase family protein, partial [Armatimonadota bacterium]
FAGGGRAGRVDWRRAFEPLSVDWQVEVAPTPEDALYLATQFCQSGGEVLVVAGGDGTVHTVLPALVGSPTALALCPLGTSNVLARELGYPLGRRALDGCVSAMRAGQVRQVDVGTLRGRPFALMVSAGFDAHVVRHVPEPLKKRLGVYAFLWTGLQELRRYQPARYRLALPDRELEEEAVILVVTNTSRYGWFTTIAPHARMDDGMLDVVWMSAVRTWRRAIWRVLVDVMTGRAGKCPYLRYERATTVRVEAFPTQPAQCDGEPAGETPLSVGILPGALRVIAPSPPAPSRNAV